MSFKGHILAVCCAVTLFAGGAQAQTRTTKSEYIQKYQRYALENQETHGVPASITMAQAILESDCGNSRLAVEGNNHFGIKCKSDWKGGTIHHDDDALQECFRKYASAEASFRDHCDFLDKSPRYASLFELDPLDYKGWARGLKAAGYATNPKYADILIRTIEENELYALDNMDVSGLDLASASEMSDGFIREPVTLDEVRKPVQAAANRIDPDNYVVEVSSKGGYAQFANNGSAFVVAKEGDTYATLAGKLRISERKLRKINDAEGNIQLSGGEPVYVKAKSNRALNGKLIHAAVEGETMHSISQAYGIKLKKLLKLNRRPADGPLRAGAQIRLA